MEYRPFGYLKSLKMKTKKKLKKRNPLWNHPKLKKGGRHDKMRKRDKQNEERDE